LNISFDGDGKRILKLLGHPELNENFLAQDDNLMIMLSTASIIGLALISIPAHHQ
jgi:hypothetical protein